MIDIKDLMAGNWVVCPKGLAKVKVMDSRTGDVLVEQQYEWCGHAELLEPITITAAVMDACGAKTPLGYSPNIYYVDGLYFRFCEYEHFGPQLQERDEDGWFEDFSWHMPSPYLHDLQNIYRTLTGAELKIDEEKLKQALCHGTDGRASI